MASGWRLYRSSERGPKIVRPSFGLKCNRPHANSSGGSSCNVARNAELVNLIVVTFLTFVYGQRIVVFERHRLVVVRQRQ